MGAKLLTRVCVHMRPDFLSIYIYILSVENEKQRKQADKKPTGAGPWSVSDECCQSPAMETWESICPCFRSCIGNTHIAFLHAITDEPCLAAGGTLILLPTTQLIQNPLDLVGVGLLQRLAGFTETLAPDFHGTSTNWRNAIKFNVFSLNEVEMEDSE